MMRPSRRAPGAAARLVDGAHSQSAPNPTPDITALLDGDRATTTWQAYRADWRAFHTWCQTSKRRPLPADTATLLAWLHEQAADGYAVATIARRLNVVGQVHHQHGHISPTDAPAVKAAWRGIRRQLGTAVRKVAPVTIEILRRMVATCDQTPAGRRDHALLVIGFAGALRRSELAGLVVADLEVHPAGIILTIRRSKSDQHGAGHRLGLPTGSSLDTCPVRQLRAWTNLAGLVDGPLFRPVDRHRNIAHRHLSGRAVAEIVKRRARAAGLDPERYSGHSLRAGFATSAAASGATEIAIARQTRHRSMTVLRGYIREGDLFRTNAATTIGL